MGTPASVVSDPPGRAATASRDRKRASANIFHGLSLPELRSLFRSGGADRPEERARLVWRYRGQRRMAGALRRLRRRHPARPGPALAALQSFSRLRITEEEAEGGAEVLSGSVEQRRAAGTWKGSAAAGQPGSPRTPSVLGGGQW